MTRNLADLAIDEALAVLRKEFAGTGWRFSTVWASAAGPDVRRLTASRGVVLLTARDLAEMREKISRENQDPEEAPGASLFGTRPRPRPPFPGGGRSPLGRLSGAVPGGIGGVLVAR